MTTKDTLTLSAVESTLEIVQFTDLHLIPAPEQHLWGINPYANFSVILQAATAEYPRAKLCLLTGDLVHNPVAEAYLLLRDCLVGLNYSIFRLPGNHDDSKLIDEYLSTGNIHKEQALQLGNWQIILLNTNASTPIGGRLDVAELERLDKYLLAYPNHHTLVCLHHHPVSINSSWMDEMALQNPGDLFDIMDRHSQVRGVIWGHIHQEFDSERKGVRLLGAPATSVQFVPHCNHFKQDSLGPGFRWLGLHPNGQIETKVHYFSSSDEQYALRRR